MPQVKTAQSITLPAPTLGMNWRDSFANMDPRFSPWLLNADCENGYIAARPGIPKFCWPGGVNTGQVLALGTYSAAPLSNYKLYAWVKPVAPATQSEIYDISTGTPSLVYSSPSLSPSAVSVYNFAAHSFFMTNLESFNDNTLFDGTTWSQVNLTGGLAPSYYIVGYKGHLYGGGASHAYGYHQTIGGIAGATEAQDLTNIFETDGYMAFIAPFSTADGLTNEVLLAFGSSSGEVLIYSGDNPDSSTWALRARFFIGLPLGYQNWIPYNNDALILTATGLVSLRELYQRGYEADVNDTISSPIDPYWNALAKNQAANYWDTPFKQWSGVYWPEKKRILILARGGLSELGVYNSGLCTIFSYNVITRAWSIWQPGFVDAANVSNLTYYNGNVYFISNYAVMKIDDTVFYDTSYADSGSTKLNYTSHISSAWTVPGGANTKKINGIELIQYTDLTSTAGTSNQTAVLANTDFKTDYSSSNFSSATVPSGYSKIGFTTGASGTFIQSIVQKDTDILSTKAYRLYAQNIIFEQGGLLS